MSATTDRERMATVVIGLADRVGRRLRAKGRAGHRLTVRVRYPGPRSVTRSRKLEGPTASTAALAESAAVLLDRALEAAAADPVTLIGISVSDLVSDDVLQLALLDHGAVTDPGSATDLRRRSLDRAVDAVRERFGRDLMRLGTSGRGDDDFRRLWEKS